MNEKDERYCVCATVPRKYAGPHVVSKTAYFAHLRAAKKDNSKRGNLTDKDIAELDTGHPRQQPRDIPNHAANQRQYTPEHSVDGGPDEDSDDNDANNINNWSGSAFRDGCNSPEDESDSEDEGENHGNESEKISDTRELLKSLELHRLYRAIGRKSWAMLQETMLLHFNVQLRDGKTYGNRVRKTIEVPSQKYDKCSSGCMAFTGVHATKQICHYCYSPRYLPKSHPTDPNVPAAQFDYIPIAPRLISQYSNPIRAEELQSYHHRYADEPADATLTDWTGGRIHHRLRQAKFLLNRREVACQMSLDEIALTNKRVDKNKHKVMVVFIYLLNLRPHTRFTVANTMLSMVISGGYRNESFDTFLWPMVQEFQMLSAVGVEAQDASRGNAKFNLRAHLILVTGDGRATAKAMGMTEPGNAGFPCRTCEIKAVYHEPSKHYYVVHEDAHFASPNALPIRRGLANKIDQWPNVHGGAKGIARRSCLRDIPTLYWPESFPHDTMHAVALNITKELFNIIWGVKWDNVGKPKYQQGRDKDTPPAPRNDLSDYYLSKNEKRYVNNALRDARRTVPSYISPPGRSVGADHANFKTAEWKAALLVYLPVFLLGAIPHKYYRNFKDLSDLYTLLQNRSVRQSDIAHLWKLATRFVKEYQELYYTQFDKKGKDKDNLPRIQACTLQPHSLLHISDDTANWGPSVNFAQWLPEGYFGWVKRQADCPPKMIRSLMNGVMDETRYAISRFSIPGQYQTTEPGPTSNELIQPAHYWELSKDTYAWERFKEDILSKEPYTKSRFKPEELLIRVYGGLRLSTGAKIVAEAFQPKTDVNRDNSRIAFYYNSWDMPLYFGRVKCFIRVESSVGGKPTLSHSWDMAWVEGINYTKDPSGVCTQTSTSYSYWIVTDYIVGLVGLAPITVEVKGKPVKKTRIVGKDGLYNELHRCILS